ncbi:MAG: winged helix-turn-helix domain-containing protein [Candidatus Neomarinimicrobiota bacterium]
MPVPDFQSFFKPLLDLAADGKEHSISEARVRLVDAFDMTEEDLAELLPSGQQTKYDNRIHWAKAYFIQSKVLSSPRQGYFQITDRGRKLHNEGHDRIDVKILNRYPEFVAFHSPPRTKKVKPGRVERILGSSSTPEELLQQAYQSLRNELAGELLSKVKDNIPRFF